MDAPAVGPCSLVRCTPIIKRKFGGRAIIVFLASMSRDDARILPLAAIAGVAAVQILGADSFGNNSIATWMWRRASVANGRLRGRLLGEPLRGQKATRIAATWTPT